jgi:perosamine synthetase
MVAHGARARVTAVRTLIPVARPALGEREAEAARRAILSGWVSQGPEVAAFEQEFAAAVDASRACAVSSCTTALHLALVALGVGLGDEVVTVSHSFIATANAIRYCGATPVFVDVELDTFNMDASQLEAAIGPRTRAILAVHQLGMPCDLQAITSIARRHSLPVIEDAACAIGSEIRWNGAWQPIGRPHGDVACFSFHPRKLLSTGDGGMLTTRSEELDRRFRLLRQHGMSVPDTVRHQASQVTFEDYLMVGFNYRMTDIQGAIGREQIKRLPSLVAGRRERAARYHAALRTVAGVKTPAEPQWARSNWQSYAVRVAHGRQRPIMQALLDEGISTRRGVMNAHREQAYPAGTWRVAPGHGLERSEEAQDTAIVLPLFHDLDEADQNRVIDAVTKAVSAHA